MLKTSLKVLLGLAFCAALAFSQVYSSLSFAWESQNLDGSSSITWRSIVALLILMAASQLISFWTFRRRIALQVSLGLILSVTIAALILNSGVSFSWEHPLSDGTFSITWRTDLILLALLSIPQGIMLVIFRLARAYSVRGRAIA